MYYRHAARQPTGQTRITRGHGAVSGVLVGPARDLGAACRRRGPARLSRSLSEAVGCPGLLNGVVQEAVPELAQGSRQQSGNVHLGDAEPPGDLLLSEVAVKAQNEDALLAPGQFVPVPGDGLHVHGPVYRRVILAEQAAELAGIVLAGQRRVQRQGCKALSGLTGLAQLV